MVGIVLLSHGSFAEGLKETLEMFFGNNIEQLETICFRNEDNIDDFEKEIGKKINEVDKGDGVVVFCDLFAGTPAHKTTKYLGDNVKVVVGMNAPMLLELLGLRDSFTLNDLESLMNTGKEGIREWKIEKNDEDSFFD